MTEESVVEQLDKIAVFDPEALVSSKTEAIDFRGCRYVFGEMTKAARDLLSLPIGDLPDAVLRRLEAPLKCMIDVLVEIEDFNRRDDGSEVERNEIAERAKARWKTLDSELQPRIEYLQMKAGRLSERPGWTSTFPSWFFAITALAYATGFLTVTLFHESYGLRALDDTVFKMKYAHVGLLCLAIPSILVFSAFAVSNYLLQRSKTKTGETGVLTLRKYVDPWLTVTITAMAAIFYLALVFAPPSTFHTLKTQVLLILTIVSAYSLRAIATYYRRADKRELERRWRKAQTIVLLVLLGWAVSLNEDNLVEVFWPVAAPWFGLIVLVGVVFCAFRDRLSRLLAFVLSPIGGVISDAWKMLGDLVQRIGDSHMGPIVVLGFLFAAWYWRYCLASMTGAFPYHAGGVWYLALPLLLGFLNASVRNRVAGDSSGKGTGFWQAILVCVFGLIYFFMVVVFGYRVFHYIPAAKGGGDFSDARLVRISLKKESRVDLPRWLFEDNHDQKLVLIEGTSTSVFLANPAEKGGPPKWRQSREDRPRVAEIARSDIGSLDYLDETYTEWQAHRSSSPPNTTTTIIRTTTTTTVTAFGSIPPPATATTSGVATTPRTSPANP